MSPEIWSIIGLGISLCMFVFTLHKLMIREMDARFRAVDSRFEQAEKRSDERFEQAEKRSYERFEQVDRQIEGLSSELKEARKDIAKVDNRVSRVEGSLETIIRFATGSKDD